MAKGSPPPPPPPPPAPKSKSKPTGERGVFNSFINAHKALKPYAQAIWSWANYYGGITPTELAATIWFESGGNANAKSSAGALGLAQIFDNSASPTNLAGVPFFRTDHNISQQDKLNPAFAIQYMAWRMSGAVQHYGSIDQAYIQGYNPGYTASASPISSVLPKGYVGTPSQTIDQSATKSVTTSQVTSSIKDPWVVHTANGQIKFVNSVNPPKNAVLYGGQPITRSQFNSVWKQTYQDTFFAYTGRQATGKEIIQILGQAPSVYTLANQLADKPSFDKSPVYKKSAPGLVSYARTILGQNWKPSGGIIRQAIAQNWDQATFYSHLRQLPAYQQGPEFRDNEAKMQAQFESVFGPAAGDQKVMSLIKQKTLNGWTPDEFAVWLRQQPAYKNSAEYQAKSVSFLQQLGLITGAQATLSGDQVNSILGSKDQVATPPTPPPSTTPFPNVPVGTRPDDRGIRAGI